MSSPTDMRSFFTNIYNSLVNKWSNPVYSQTRWFIIISGILIFVLAFHIYIKYKAIFIPEDTNKLEEERIKRERKRKEEQKARANK
jgi:hypothetical protein